MNSQAGLVAPRFAPQEFIGHKKAGIAPCLITTPFVALGRILESQATRAQDPLVFHYITHH
jgi:hypothetical protein